MARVFRFVTLFCLVLAATISAAGAERVALVIGNSAYRHAPPLPNPVRDARGVAGALESVGFKVLLGIDLDQAGTNDLLQKFSRELEGAEAGLFFYAGHGLQVDGVNYLVPVEARLSDPSDLDFQAVDLSLAIRQLQRAPTGLVFLDACRDNPLAQTLARSMGATRSGGIGRGLASVQSGLGTLIAFATQPGNVALDGTGAHSPFTEALLEHIRVPGLEIRQLMTRVRKAVVERTGGKQVPWDHSSLTGDFFIVPAKAAPAPAVAVPVRAPAAATAQPLPAAPAAEDDRLFWESVKDSASALEFEAYLDRFPNGTFAAIARIRAEELRRPGPAAALAPAAAEAAAAPAPQAARDPEPASGAELRRSRWLCNPGNSSADCIE